MPDPPGETGVPISPLESQIRELFGRVAYSHKTHEKAADLLQARLHRLKTAEIVLSAITTTGLLATIFAQHDAARYTAIIAALFSTAVLALTTYTKDFDLGSKSQAHTETATRLWDIRESYLSLLGDLRSGALDEATARERRDQLQGSLGIVYRSAQRTSQKAYTEAQKALQVREDLTFSDAEIDSLLPSALRHGDAT